MNKSKISDALNNVKATGRRPGRSHHQSWADLHAASGGESRASSSCLMASNLSDAVTVIAHLPF
ncbi:hypothetical protein [Agrobacterium pusense]|uniref:Uncharacterized protein n=1 Tax=Agrobacterium pusense TaxID=648995 RepID=A0AA44EHF8_9HYPH|nr:hypothetical protein [Agrobacterium pusense]NRF07603.1 hypothetical protein [Agrobacterium pusense]NRF18335.1 hypothetical protein [Agrobacterium pusense]